MKRFTVITLLLCSISALVIFTSCSPAAPPASIPSPSASPSAAYDSPAATAAQTAPAPQINSVPPPPPDAAPSLMEPADNESFFPLPILAPAETDRLLVYTAAMGLQTTDFMPGIRRLLNTVGEMDGYLTYFEVSGHDIRGPGWERSARFTFRIPTENLSEFVVIVENNYNIWWLRQVADDETDSFQYSVSNLDDLRDEERWLVEELDRAETSGARVNIQSRLSRVRRQIREHGTTQAAIMDAVIYSTVEIELFEAFISQEEVIEKLQFSERLGKATSNSVNGFIAFIQGLVILIVSISPLLVIMALCTAITLPVVRIIKKRKQKQEISQSFTDQIESDEDRNE